MSSVRNTDYGARLETIVQRKKRFLELLISIFVLFMTYVLFNVDVEDHMVFLNMIVLTLIFFWLLLFSLRQPSQKNLIIIYENGLRSPVFKWTGSEFLHFSEFKDIQYEKMTIRGNTHHCVLLFPKDCDKYKPKRSLKNLLLVDVQTYIYGAPLRIDISLTDIPPLEIFQKCYKAFTAHKRRSQIGL